MSRDLMHGDEVKALVREAYRQVPPTTAAVAHKLYSADELAMLPDSAVSVRWASPTICATPTSDRAR